LIESQETTNLVDPQVIGLMKIDEAEALECAKTWLGKGWFTPDDLSDSARQSILRPAYYPFWTFDGTLEINWRGEIKEGDSENAYWVSRSGVEYEFFDDELVPGISTLDPKAINQIAPFELKEVLAFQPEYLAGWPALTYDIPLAKATLLAREQVVKKVRRELRQRVYPLQEKRNLNTGASNWSSLTFKHALLPLWVGTYTYQGQIYRVLINGQTGKVSGDKPRDRVQVVAIILSVILTAVLLLIILFILYAELSNG
jgi:hypothetical protein